MTPKEDYGIFEDNIFGTINEIFVTRFGHDDGEPRRINYHLLTEKLCGLFKPITYNSRLYVRNITQDEETYCREEHLVRSVILEIFMFAAQTGFLSEQATYAKERRELFEMVKDFNVVTRNPFNKPEGNLLYDENGAFTLKDGGRA